METFKLKKKALSGRKLLEVANNLKLKDLGPFVHRRSQNKTGKLLIKLIITPLTVRNSYHFF